MVASMMRIDSDYGQNSSRPQQPPRLADKLLDTLKMVYRVDAEDQVKCCVSER